MAAIPESGAPRADVEPERGVCEICGRPVFVFLLNGKRIAVEPHEWEPRAACPLCGVPAGTDDRCGYCGGPIPEGSDQRRKFCCGAHRRLAHEERRDGGACSRCGGERYVGSRRPAAVMVGVDVAWSDEGHVRLVGPGTKRMRGEALMPLHQCHPA